jgi:glycosyltransferase involved in cell wall biosynthesis
MIRKELNVLLISSDYFYPPSNGNTLRDYNIFKNFSKDFRFDLLTFGDEEHLCNREKLAAQLGPCFENVFMVPASTLKKTELRRGISKLKNIFFPHKFSIGKPYYSEQMARIVNENMSSSKYDLIFFCDFSMRYLHDVYERTNYIVDVQDSPSLLFKSYFNAEKQLRKKIMSYMNYVWAKRYERIYLSKVKNMIFVSLVDQVFVKRNCPHSNIWVVPNGVDTEYFKPVSKETQSKNALLFTGVMGYRPNHESMVYFIKEILPLVRKKIPDIFLIIAGKDPMPELQSLAKRVPRIKLTGFVQDLRPYFNESMIYVAPIVSGAGIKNKILEAWAMGKPVVASSKCCDGIKATDGQDCLIANTPSIFAESVIRLFSSPSLRNTLAENGRRTAEEFYSWKSRARELGEIFIEVIERQAR